MNNTEYDRFINKRKELHTKLVSILGSNNVYFQPPETIKLNYPCIIYSLENVAITHADDRPYKKDFSYTITLIGTDPLSDKILKLTEIPRTKFDRRFYTNGLYHDVFTISY